MILTGYVEIESLLAKQRDDEPRKGRYPLRSLEEWELRRCYDDYVSVVQWEKVQFDCVFRKHWKEARQYNIINTRRENYLSMGLVPR